MIGFWILKPRFTVIWFNYILIIHFFYTKIELDTPSSFDIKFWVCQKWKANTLTFRESTKSSTKKRRLSSFITQFTWPRAELLYFWTNSSDIATSDSKYALENKKHHNGHWLKWFFLDACHSAIIYLIKDINKIFYYKSIVSKLSTM